MAEIVAGILGPAIQVVQYVSAPIIRQFNYLCCFSNIIANLEDEAKNLDDAKRGLQIQVDRAQHNVEVILPEVETWLSKYECIKTKTTLITNEIQNIGSGCLKLPARYVLSKRATKASHCMQELREKCIFSSISEPAPPAAMEQVPLGSTYDFESRKRDEEDIMTALRSTDLNMIGICGMGGIGKTTMAKRIMNKVLQEQVFDEVVMAVISQQVDDLKLQLEIAGSLGLRLEGESSQARVQKLRTRLTGTTKVLLVLDDVWKVLALDELGIPCKNGSRGCRILLTTRNIDVLRAMDVGKVCGLQILSELESWFLFREKAGMCVDDTVLNPIANDVMRECKGLPIALATVGVALRDENELSIWEDALRQLRKSNPSDIPNIITQVYNPLKLSYDYLDTEHAKSTFLLCSLFAEDDDIPLEHLAYFAMGLHMLEGIWELEEVRGRTRALIKMLKTRCLLLDGCDEDHVRMHDVVRDVSIYIASKERYVKCNDCTWISSFVDGVRADSDFPNLKLLFIDNKVEQEIKINDRLIGGTRELNVVFIRNGLVRSLQSLQLVKSLTTLILYRCPSLFTISVVGQFESLEILICDHCDWLEELPVQVRGLKRLRLLEFLYCYRLKRIAPGVISSMVGLEELKMVKSFGEWEIEEGKERGNAGLRELESLTNLRCLEIQVFDSRLVAQPLHLSPKLVKFTILFGKYNGFETVSRKSYQRRLSLTLSDEKSFSADLSTNMLVTSTEILFARTVNSADIKVSLENIKWLSLEGFRNMKNLTSSAAAFPILEFLSLRRLDDLEEIWDGPIPSHSFNNLKELTLESLPELEQLGKKSPPPQCQSDPLFPNLSFIYITGCKRLHNLFSLPKTKDCLLQLETIRIWSCDEMEHLLEFSGNENDRTTLVFPELKILHLESLPKLMSISKGIEAVEFPVLAELNITSCRNMKSLVSSDDNENNHYKDDDDGSLHMFCQPKVSFGKLKKVRMCEVESEKAWCDQIPIDFFTRLELLQIDNYSKIRSLFAPTIAQNLINLKTLLIGDCGEMVKVVEDLNDDNDCISIATKDDGRPLQLIFPSLQHLRLYSLAKLESFCEWRISCGVELPSLDKLWIDDCPEMTSFGSLLITPALQTIIINRRYLESGQDFNAALQQHFQKLKEEKMKKNEGGFKVDENRGRTVIKSIEDPICSVKYDAYPSFKQLLTTTQPSIHKP